MSLVLKNKKQLKLVLFFDIKSFTKITEKFLKYNKVGSEELSILLDKIFTTTTQIVSLNKGRILTYEGDAFSASFDYNTEQDLKQFINCALQLNRFMESFSDYSFSGKKIKVQAKIGLAFGSVITSSTIFGEDKVFYHYGIGITDSANAQNLSNGENIIISKDLVELLSDFEHIKYRMLNDKYFEITSFNSAYYCQEYDHGVNNKSIKKNTKNSYFKNTSTIFITSYDLKWEYFDQLLSRISSLSFELDLSKPRIYISDKGCSVLVYSGLENSELSFEKTCEFSLRLKEIISENSNLNKSKFGIGISEFPAYLGYVGTPENGDFICCGPSANVASRLASYAYKFRKNEDIIILSTNTKNSKIRRINYKFNFIEDVKLRGIRSKLPVYELQNRSLNQVQSYTTKFVGRKKLLETISKILTNPKKNKNLIFIHGEAGIGKTRTVNEILNRFTSDKETLILNFYGDEFYNSSFKSILTFLKSYIGLSETSNIQEKDLKFINFINLLKKNPAFAQEHESEDSENILANLDDGIDVLKYYLGLAKEDEITDISPQSRKLFFENCLTSILTIIGFDKKVIFFIEDLHWLDSETASFLKNFILNTILDKFTFLITSREDDIWNINEFSEELVMFKEEISGIEYNDLDLFVSNLYGNAITSSENLKSLFKDKTNLNPFFIEQLFDELNYKKLLRFSSSNNLYIPKMKTDLLPKSMDEIIISKFERYNKEYQEVISIASVIGFNFDLKLLLSMIETNSNANSVVEALIKDKIFFKSSDSKISFTHRILRDIAYKINLESKLVTLNSNLAKMYISIYSDSLDLYYEIIGDHYETAKYFDEARTFYYKAADKAKSEYLHEEEIRILDKILKIESDKNLKGQIFVRQIESLSTIGKREQLKKKCDKVIEIYEPESTIYQTSCLLVATAFRKSKDFDIAKVYLTKVTLAHNKEIYVNYLIEKTYITIESNEDVNYTDFNLITEYFDNPFELSSKTKNKLFMFMAYYHIITKNYSKADTILNEIRNHPSFSIKETMNHLFMYSTVLISRSEHNKARGYLDEAYAIAAKSHNIQMMIFIKNNQLLILKHQNMKSEWLEMLKSLQFLCKKHNFVYQYFKYLKLEYYHICKSNSLLSEKKYLKIIKNNKIRSLFSIELSIFEAKYLIAKEQFLECFNTLNSVKKRILNSDIIDHKISLLSTYGSIYNALKKHKQAEKYYRKILSLTSNRNNDTQFLIALINTIGAILEKPLISKYDKKKVYDLLNVYNNHDCMYKNRYEHLVKKIKEKLKTLT
ncbi:MAG: AAA family ATPase [Candidatus Delongbacteria bacterium]|nr:AAA family ATPase [Candidatus Delongbacteria bacterium]MBN2834753.1 AAA family ATPase [Candidatus Delongbacteria bacterium]